MREEFTKVRVALPGGVGTVGLDVFFGVVLWLFCLGLGLGTWKCGTGFLGKSLR